MNDVLMSLLVILLFGAIALLLARRFPVPMRPWVGLAFVEYVVAAGAQFLYSRVIVSEGGDAVLYTRSASVLKKMLDSSFDWAAGEVFAMLLQRPSVFDHLVEGAQNNTGSMFAITAWLLYFLGGSDYAANFFASGLAFLGALGIYAAFQDAAPEMPSRRLFVATALFPSIAFWTSALHKESFCIAGVGAVLTAWRAVHRGRYIMAALLAPAGLSAILLFRAPVFAPLLLGIAVFFVLDRLRRVKGPDTFIVGPAYLTAAAVFITGGMVLLTRLSPALSLDRLGETVALKQGGWSLSQGGSSFGGDVGTLSATQQLLRAPVALLNALFRPQLFDVHNFGALISALEMTVITWLVARSVIHLGPRGVVMRIQRSPFLAMCAVVTLVGCAFVGLVTLNFGSLARYRVPFLPFYGALVAVLSERAVPVAAPRRPGPATRPPARRAARQNQAAHSLRR